MTISPTNTEAASLAMRPAAHDDLSAIESLLRASQLPIAGVKETLAGFIVAEADQEIVGVIGMEFCGDSGLLRSTAVAPQWRKHGIARQLVERTVAGARARGLHAIYLLTTTAESYFTGFGFAVVPRDAVPDDVRSTVEFQGACPASATVMCLPIAAPASHRTGEG